MNKETLLKSLDQSMTCKWDVLCSYDEKKINKILADKFRTNKDKLVKEITYTKDYESKFRKVTQRYQLSLTLEEPKIQFISGERNICQVDMPIKGGDLLLTGKGNP